MESIETIERFDEFIATFIVILKIANFVIEKLEFFSKLFTNNE